VVKDVTRILDLFLGMPDLGISALVWVYPIVEADRWESLRSDVPARGDGGSSGFYIPPFA
jgi:hypothetical protein